MEKENGKSTVNFWLICLGLGIIAEESLFRGEIGASYLIFVAAFYTVFFLRFKHFPFSFQRVGYLMLICIWLLSTTFMLYGNEFFYSLNFLAIPMLIVFHLLLVTGPKKLDWTKPVIVKYAASKIFASFRYNFVFINTGIKHFMQMINGGKNTALKKILIGFVLSLPVLFIVVTLLMSADTHFKQMVSILPTLINEIRFDNIFRMIIILIMCFLFFGFFQILSKKNFPVSLYDNPKQRAQLDGIIALTLLVMLNLVYLLFTVIQFKYFFSGKLGNDFTYAQYARRGFFELVFVSLINLSVANIVLIFAQLAYKRLVQFSLSFLVLFSGVMLYSAFMRLLMYEEAYGFTFIRVLVHSFMIFLGVIFTYTLIKIWLEKLSLSHFYFISALIYYTLINVINLDQVVVKQNLLRYEQTGKIDVYYLNQLSYTGVLGLIDLYHKKPDSIELQNILDERKKELISESTTWQSFNLSKQRVYQELVKISFNKKHY